jgi:dTDP-4-dehydrorhamnose 3,5-epimerase
VRFTETPLPGVCVIDPEPITDERGSFARIYDAVDFAAHGIDPTVVQSSVSFNTRRDTLRGMHYQAAPHGEPKLVRCVRGAIYDVALDLRTDSPAYCSWFAAELDPDGGRMLFVPAGVAHGFQTLADGSEVLYQMGYEFVPEATRGVRWDDPAFGIEWPEPAGERTISERDRTYPDFTR